MEKKSENRYMFGQLLFMAWRRPVFIHQLLEKKPNKLHVSFPYNGIVFQCQKCSVCNLSQIEDTDVINFILAQCTDLLV